MKWVILPLLIAVLSGPCLAAADETDQHASQLKELELEAKKAELDFQRRMHELELEGRRAEVQRSKNPAGSRDGGPLAVLLLGMLIVRALATVWVYRDIQQYKASGLWIAIVLVGGLLALIAYILARLGNMQQARTGGA